MTDTTSTTETPAAPEKPESVGEKTPAPVEKFFTQAELDAIVGKRLTQQERQLTAQYADYNDLKTAAQRLQEIEDAQKSEQQKASDKIAELTKELAEREAAVEKANLAALKSEIARVKGVPANRLHGKTQEELEADADKYLAEVAEREQTKRNPPKPPAANLKSGASTSDSNGLSGKAKAAQALRRLQAGN